MTPKLQPLALPLAALALVIGPAVARAGTMTFNSSLSIVGSSTILEGQSLTAQATYSLTHTGSSSGNTGHFFYNFVKFHSGDGQDVRDYANGRDYSGQQTWSGLATAVVGSEPLNLEAQPAGWPGNTNASPGRNQAFDATFTYADDGAFSLNAHGDSSIGPLFGLNAQGALWISTGGTPGSGFQGPVYNQTVSVTVINVAPTFTTAPIDSLQSVGVAFPLSAAAIDPGVLDVFTFDWDLDGDGLYDDFTQSPGAGGSQSSSTNALLNTPGVYTLGLRVSDGDGGMNTHSFVVSVVPEPSSLALAGLAGVALLCVVRRRGAGR